MILKKSYWAKWLENNRRRSWTFLLCLVMALFCGPLYLMVVLTGLQNNYANDSVYNAAQAAESLRELIQSRITDVIGFSSIHVLFAAFFAILFAVLALQPQKNRSVLFGPGILKKALYADLWKRNFGL